MFGCYTRNKVDNEMPNLTLENIANACEGTYVGDPSKKHKIITGDVTYSSKVEELYSNQRTPRVRTPYDSVCI